MKKLVLRTFTLISMVIMISVIAWPALAAGKPLTWRMATLYPRGTAFGEVYEAFCSNVKAMSGGYRSSLCYKIRSGRDGLPLPGAACR